MRTEGLPFVKYVVACGAAGVAHLLTRLVWPVAEPTQSPLSFAAVVVSAWYGGFGPGLLATALTVVGKVYYFVSPAPSLRVTDTLAIVQLALFAAVAILVSSLTAALRRAEADSRAARAEAEAASRAQEVFLAAISHELRTPLQAMATWIGILRAHDVDPGRAMAAADALTRSVAAQTRLIDDLLDRARLVAGRIELVLEPVDLVSVIEAAVATARAAAPEPAAIVRTELHPTTGPVVGDAVRLEQVVRNLVSNALKFTRPDGSVVVRLEHDAARAHVIVADDGRGIPREALPHVFDAFRQARPADDGARGLGLGLAIVRHLVEVHGGTVRAYSEGTGCGATFVVTLPLAGARAGGIGADRRGGRSATAGAPRSTGSP